MMPGMGRRKIEIKKIENKKSLEVTFSKRRTGLFKKVGDLCTLCGVEAAAIVFSPGGRPFVFGHPSADSVIDRFLHEEAHSSPSVGYGQRQCLEAPESLQVEREREEAAMIGDGENGFWWDTPIGNMGLSELERFRSSIEELQKKVAVLVEEKTMMMERVPCNATIEYAIPPQSQFQFQCQPHDQDSSPLLRGVQKKTMMMESAPCKATVQYAIPPQSQFQFQFNCQPHDQESSPLLQSVQEKTMMMESVPCNATVEYATPPQFQFQFQCQPHDQVSSPLLQGVQEKTMMMESVPCNATIEYATPPESQFQFQCQSYNHDSPPLDGAPYGFDCGLGLDGLVCGFGLDSFDCGFGHDGFHSGFGHDGIACGFGLDGFDSGFGHDGIACGFGHDGFDSGFGHDGIASGFGHNEPPFLIE